MKTAEEYFWKDFEYLRKVDRKLFKWFTPELVIEMMNDFSDQQNADLKAEIQKDAVLKIAILEENGKLKERVKYLEQNSEIWKNIPEYNGDYQASSFGNIKSFKQGNESIMQIGLDGNGYRKVKLYDKGKPKTYNVSRLIAITFLNHNPDGHKIVVDHINNVRTDDRLANLQLITNRENSSKDRNGGSSKFVGVSWHKNNERWIANIRIEGKLRTIGSYTNEHEAAMAYKKALELLTNKGE